MRKIDTKCHAEPTVSASRIEKKKGVKMDGKSKDVKQEKIEKLKELVPEIFTEGKIDQHQLNLTLGEVVVTEGERYVLNWAGKTDAFKVLQETTTATLVPAEKESVEFDKTGNIFIEGENLEVLKVLQKSYYGKIKMIYIDPPYNTGSDSFIYPDRFQESKNEYLKRIGDKDEEGLLTKEGLFRKNNKESGHFHSNWLSMMYPRLFLARNLLREDGVIFVSIDDNEVHNLRLLMNEIFGEENFVAEFVWQRKSSPKGVPPLNMVVNTHEYIICYSKQEKFSFIGKKRSIEGFSNPDNDPRGLWRNTNLRSTVKSPSQAFIITDPNTGNKFTDTWAFSKSEMENLIKEKRMIFPKNSNGQVRMKEFYSEFKNENIPIVSTLGLYDGQKITQDLEKFFGQKVFDNPKSVDIIKYLIRTTISDGLILDFFAGSGTTAHAVLDLNKEDGGNREFICVQMPEKCDEDSEAFKAGYKTIAEICKERIRRVIKKVKEVIASETKQSRLKLDSHPEHSEGSRLDLGFKVFKLQTSNFKIWRSDIKEADLPKQLDAFEKPIKPESQITNMLWEILLKSGYDLNTKVEEKKLNGVEVFSVAGGEIFLALSKISEKALKEITKLKPKKFICLDSLFSGNDQLKTNTALQMKDAGIDFKTI